MPILYEPEEYAYYTVGDSLTEPEHKDMCDANIMIKRAIQGKSILTRNPGSYGYDDTTLDGVQFRIQKQQLEQELSESLQNEFTEEEAKQLKASLPEHMHERIKVKREQNRDIPETMGKNPEVKEQSHERPLTQNSSQSS